MGFLQWMVFSTCFLSSAVKSTAFKQDDYTVKLLIFHVTSYNRSYMNHVKCDLQWFNRSTRVINCNAHLLKDLSTNLQISAQFYKFASNEYRLFPIQMTHDLCREMKEDHFGLAATLAKSLNVKLQCPFKKGWINMTNGMVDYTKFPPHAPRGQYMDQLSIRDNNYFVGEIQVEAVVEEILKKWEN